MFRYTEVVGKSNNSNFVLYRTHKPRNATLFLKNHAITNHFSDTSIREIITGTKTNTGLVLEHSTRVC